MEPKKTKILSVGMVTALAVPIVVLYHFLGSHNKIFLAISAACVTAILAVFLWLLWQFTALDRRRRLSMIRRATLEGQQHRSDYSFLRKVAGVPVKFRLDSLDAATDGFSCIIGHGSSSTVFRGVLDDGTPVAVKRIDSPGDSADRAFRSEVSAIASVQHVNLVRLIGYCLVPSGGPRFLVYDYVPNGSLDRWLFPERHHQQQEEQRWRRQPKWLPWKVRYSVAIEVAKALAYLHHDCRQRVLHLDVKPENILLDEGFNACVADFGLSKLMNRDQSRVMTTVRGTRGYLAPEWLVQSGVSEKSDVYSYGMVLFELVGGRRNVAVEEDVEGNRRWSYFPSIVKEKVKNGGNIMEVVDERVLKEEEEEVELELEEEEVRRVVWVALWCAQEDTKLRPSMARVVDILEGRIDVEKPPETEMVVVDLLALGETGQSCAPVRLPSAAQLRTPASPSGSIMSTLSPR